MSGISSLSEFQQAHSDPRIQGAFIELPCCEALVRDASCPDAGDISRSTTLSDFRVYVSSAGRLFSRFVRQNAGGGRSNMSELGPGGATSFTGVGQGSRTTRFESRQL